MTLEDRFILLIDTKSAIKNKLIEKGAVITTQTPFSSYPEIIETLINIEDTTEISDLLNFEELDSNFGITDFVEYNYTEEEINKIMELLNKIVEGEE